MTVCWHWIIIFREQHAKLWAYMYAFFWKGSSEFQWRHCLNWPDYWNNLDLVGVIWRLYNESLALAQMVILSRFVPRVPFHGQKRPSGLRNLSYPLSGPYWLSGWTNTVFRICLSLDFWRIQNPGRPFVVSGVPVACSILMYFSGFTPAAKSGTLLGARSEFWFAMMRRRFAGIISDVLRWRKEQPNSPMLRKRWCWWMARSGYALRFFGAKAFWPWHGSPTFGQASRVCACSSGMLQQQVPWMECFLYGAGNLLASCCDSERKVANAGFGLYTALGPQRRACAGCRVRYKDFCRNNGFWELSPLWAQSPAPLRYRN